MGEEGRGKVGYRGRHDLVVIAAAAAAIAVVAISSIFFIHSFVCWWRSKSPINPTFNGPTARCNPRTGVHGTFYSGDGGIPGMVYLAVELDFDYLTTGIIDV